jgi:hypothetical protein
MNKYICDCCGGKINPATMECEYCGTHFKEDYINDSVIRIETYRNPVETLAAATMIPDEMIKSLGPEKASEYAVHVLAKKLSEGIVPFMVLQSEFDPCRYHHKIEARVKLIVPKEGINNWIKGEYE